MFLHKANRISGLDKINIKQNMNQNTCKSGRKPVQPAEHVPWSMSKLQTSAACRTCLKVHEQVTNQCCMQNMYNSQLASYKPVPPAEHASQSRSKLQTSATCTTCPTVNEQVTNQCRLHNMSHSQRASYKPVPPA